MELVKIGKNDRSAKFAKFAKFASCASCAFALLAVLQQMRLITPDWLDFTASFEGSLASLPRVGQ
jgi:hypothetical protein